MNLLLLMPEDRRTGESRVSIGGRRAAHMIDVVGVSVGSTIEVGEVGGRLGTATVTAIEAGRLSLEVTLDRPPPPRLDVRLVLALPRPPSLRRILHICAVMGVRSISLIHTRRVEKSFWSSPVLDDERVRRELLLGLEQGRDTVMPEVHQYRRFKPFVEDHLPAIAGGTLKLVGDLVAERVCPTAVGEPITIVIGPEGGLVDYEIGRLCEAGFTPVHLGPRALRVEQAVPAFLGRLASYAAAEKGS